MTNETSQGLVIRGIDGITPIGFLAAVGLLQVLRDSPSSWEKEPRLSWRQLDTWRPVLHGPSSIDFVAEIVDEDRTQWADSPILGFRYVKLEKQGPRIVGGLRAPLPVVRAWTHTRRAQEDENSLAYGAALFCQDVFERAKQSATRADHDSAGITADAEVDMNLLVERSFLDFTSRNAQFLEQVELIRHYVTRDRIVQALEQGKVDYNAPRTLDWDPAADTPGAIYTGFQRGYLPVHEWLGFRGLRFLPVAGKGSRVRMTACTGRRLDGAFIWPLWERPASVDAVRGLLGHPDLVGSSPAQRQAFGVSQVLAAGLSKKADGYTGTFAPIRPL